LSATSAPVSAGTGTTETGTNRQQTATRGRHALAFARKADQAAVISLVALMVLPPMNPRSRVPRREWGINAVGKQGAGHAPMPQFRYVLRLFPRPGCGTMRMIMRMMDQNAEPAVVPQSRDCGGDISPREALTKRDGMRERKPCRKAASHEFLFAG
jgi:hypothetical protein